MVLAARRASNTGIPVVVATSDEPSDDGLARVLQQHGISCFRGSLDDTLGRLVQACAGLADDTIIIRLTADNPLPDGALLDELIQHFVAEGLEYLCCNGIPSGLPYGMSAELTRMRHLREADSTATLAADREHVTPAIMRKFGRHYFEKYRHLGKGHYRCTVDNFDDYRGMQQLFLRVPDPVGASALALADELARLPYQPLAAAPVPRLVVGGAQLGLPYGIANAQGKPSLTLAEAILKTAVGNGARWIDTASAYGSSEQSIGTAMGRDWAGRAEIVTKLSPLEECPKGAAPAEVAAHVDASIFRSCTRLRRDFLDVVLLHRAQHLNAWDGMAWDRLRELRQAGWIGKLGVSVQTPEELEGALDRAEVAFVQMPFNLLDWRWDGALDRLRRARAERNLVLHVRSSLLQGLLASRDPALWSRAHLHQPGQVWAWMDEQVSRAGRKGIVDLALAYALAQDWIDGVVVGMETLDQLQENINHFNAPGLDASQIRELEATRPMLGADSLDPATWLKA